MSVAYVCVWLAFLYFYAELQPMETLPSILPSMDTVPHILQTKTHALNRRSIHMCGRDAGSSSLGKMREHHPYVTRHDLSDIDMTEEAWQEMVLRVASD